MFERIKHVHFVGIGGSGMSGIAEVLLTLGYRVTGSDLHMTEVTSALLSAGAEIFSSHSAENIRGAHVVVRSSAIPDDNVELVEAALTKLPLISRAEMLAELARLKYTAAVAGTHGKTTTTSMMATILDCVGMDPTFVIGGRLKTVGRNARLGKGEFFVLEADESDRSFLTLSPTIAVVTNIEADHLDYYRDLEDIKEAFVSFVNKVPFYGAVIACADDPAIQDIFPRIKRRVISYGFSEESEVAIVDCELEPMGSRFTLRFNGKKLQDCVLKIPGIHNVLNATAAFTAALEMGVEAKFIASGLEEFTGVERRFEIKSRTNIFVVDDYAHHPTEVRATLRTASSGGFRRVIAVFQPHRYSRTQTLFDDFARSFEEADDVIVTDIYAAGEKPVEGVHSKNLVQRIKELGASSAIYVADFDAIRAYILEHAETGDAVVIMGAGSITSLADELGLTIEQREPVKVNHD